LAIQEPGLFKIPSYGQNIIFHATVILVASALPEMLSQIGASIPGRVGACVQNDSGTYCTRGSERFSLQSVMKLLVGVAVLDRVDRGEWRLMDEVVVRREDLSLHVQPLAKLVGERGFATDIGDLVRRAVIASDSAATDVLLARLGGPAKVQELLRAKGLTGIRIDRDVRHLQTETLGLKWRPEYVDAAVFDRAVAATPKAKRAAAYRRYQADERDTATPQGMTTLLWELAHGRLLSPASTEFLLRAMRDTTTFPDRLKAGLAPGWSIGHKTGTSGAWEGVTAATNDVGILFGPRGERIAVTVFIGDSPASATERAAVMARMAAAAIR
jgi:beta-lactamase class A